MTYRAPRKSHERRAEYELYRLAHIRERIENGWFSNETVDYFAVKQIEHQPPLFEIEWERPA